MIDDSQPTTHFVIFLSFIIHHHNYTESEGDSRNNLIYKIIVILIVLTTPSALCGPVSATTIKVYSRLLVNAAVLVFRISTSYITFMYEETASIYNILVVRTTTSSHSL